MTWRTVWGEPFPEWADHATEEDAHRFALRVSREQGVEVAVVAIPGPESPALPLSGGSVSDGREVGASGAQIGAERTRGR